MLLPRHLLMRFPIFDNLTRLAARSLSCASTPLWACIHFVSPGACQLLLPIQTHSDPVTRTFRRTYMSRRHLPAVPNHV
jgi:hypothetical protein